MLRNCGTLETAFLVAIPMLALQVEDIGTDGRCLEYLEFQWIYILSSAIVFTL